MHVFNGTSPNCCTFGYRAVPTDDNGPLQLHRGEHTRQDPPSNANITSKVAFILSVGTLNGLLRHLED